MTKLNEDEGGSVQVPVPLPNDELDVDPMTITRRVSTVDSQDAFDPQTFDPMNLTFLEVLVNVPKCKTNAHFEMIKDALLRFSLLIKGIGACAEEDLMLAAYFYLEEKFDVKAQFQICVRYTDIKHKGVVAVVLTRIQTVEDILTKAESHKVLKNKVRRNKDFELMCHICGVRER